jgi:hypothetical protein
MAINYENEKSASPPMHGTKLQRHERFVISLEKHGSSGPPAWEKIASDLGCSVTEVQEYAHLYLSALLELDQDIPIQDMEVKAEDGWTLSETLLFEALLIQYLPEMSRETPSATWNQSMATHIPGKTPQQIKDKYQSSYASKEQQSRKQST